MIRVQDSDFDIGEEISCLTDGRTDVGAIVTFTGTVRDMADGKPITEMVLEYYPGMTEKALIQIEAQAHERWPLQDLLIIHRYGPLKPGDNIVLVITVSAHRGAAFEAAQFVMDYLKTQAPFWKLEKTSEGAQWVDAKEQDDIAAHRWEDRGV